MKYLVSSTFRPVLTKTVWLTNQQLLIVFFLVLMTCDETVANVENCSGLMVLFCNDFSYLNFSIDLFTEGVGMQGNALVNVSSWLGYILVPF